MTNLFGPVIDAEDVEGAVIATLQKWGDTYIAEAENRKGLERGFLDRPLPGHFQTTADFEKWPETPTPSVLVLSPGMKDKPTREGRGEYTARWIVGIAVICSADTEENANRNAKIYAAAFRTLLLQRPSLDGFAHGLDWEDERYDDLPAEDHRSLAAGQVLVTVEVRGVGTSFGGPKDPTTGSEPEADPHADPGDWPEMEDKQVTVEPEEDE